MTRLRVMKRVASGRQREYVVVLRPDGVELRPKRARRPDAAVCVTWDWIYTRALLARPLKRRRRRATRGLLTTKER